MPPLTAHKTNIRFHVNYASLVLSSATLTDALRLDPSSDNRLVTLDPGGTEQIVISLFEGDAKVTRAHKVSRNTFVTRISYGA